MPTVKDDQGNRLKRVLLQVMDSDEQIDLTDQRHNKFLMVWVPDDQVLGELRLTDIIEEFDQMKTLIAERAEAKAQLDRDIANIQREMTKLQEENKTKTEELRQLHKERDPERVAYAVAHAVKERTASLEDSIRARNKTIGDLEREITELKASKRRLKEANERLKNNK